MSEGFLAITMSESVCEFLCPHQIWAYQLQRHAGLPSQREKVFISLNYNL